MNKIRKKVEKCNSLKYSQISSYNQSSARNRSLVQLEHIMASASSSISYLDSFNQERIKLANGEWLPMPAVRLSRSNLFQTAYAILAYCDDLKAKDHLMRDRLLLEAFTSLTLQKSGDATTDRVVSLKGLARRVVDLYDNYLDFQFLDATILANHRPGRDTYCSLWTFETNESGKQALVPTDEGKVILCRATLGQLARAFTFYLVETVRRMFPRGLEEHEWESSAATYVVYTSRGRSTQSSADFAAFAGVLLEIYDDVCQLSEDCHEYQALEDAAVLAGKAERDARQPRHHAQPRVGRRPQTQQLSDAPKSQRKIQVRTTQANRFATLPTDGDDDAEVEVETASA